MTLPEALAWLAHGPLDWLVVKPCPLCRQPQTASGLTGRPCPRCANALMLPVRGLSGTAPLPWWAAAPYDGAYRRLLLDLRQRPRQESIAALLQGVEPPTFPAGVSPWMVPVPSWKRRANPLPALICRLGCRRWHFGNANLLRRSRPVLGQHHLNRVMRLENQKGAFTCCRRAQGSQARQHPVFLVDDILTSGATALSAAVTLRQAGWRVQGLICLARTPGQRQAISGDLRSASDQGDMPG